MAQKKKILSIAPFDDVVLLGITTTLQDYAIAGKINKAIDIDLKKLDDIQEKTNGFSFYYYDAGENLNAFNLVQVTKKDEKLLELKPTPDYLLIIRNALYEDRLKEWLKAIRAINGIVFVSELKETNKTIGEFLERVELHEFDLVRSTALPKGIKKIED